MNTFCNQLQTLLSQVSKNFKRKILDINSLKFLNKGYNLCAIRRPAKLYNTNLISVEIWMFSYGFYSSISLTNVPVIYFLQTVVSR